MNWKRLKKKWAQVGKKVFPDCCNHEGRRACLKTSHHICVEAWASFLTEKLTTYLRCYVSWLTILVRRRLATQCSSLTNYAKHTGVRVYPPRQCERVWIDLASVMYYVHIYKTIFSVAYTEWHKITKLFPEQAKISIVQSQSFKYS